MTFSNYLLFLQKILELFPFTLLDLLFFACLCIFVISERQRYFVRSLLTFLLTGLVAMFSLMLYKHIASFLQLYLSFSKGLADGLGFLVLAFLLTGIAFICYRLILLNVQQELLQLRIWPGTLLAGTGTFIIIVTCVATVFLSLPVTEFIKNSISRSIVVNGLVIGLQSVESTQNRILGRPLFSLFNFLVPDPTHTEEAPIQSHGSLILIQTEATALFEHINTERQKKNVLPLSIDKDITFVAGTLAQGISANQILSREEVNGSTPFDLLAQSRIQYKTAYFIPIYAQNAGIAFHGVQQIPVYYQQLLSAQYSRIGIGAVELNEQGYVFSILVVD